MVQTQAQGQSQPQKVNFDSPVFFRCLWCQVWHWLPECGECTTLFYTSCVYRSVLCAKRLESALFHSLLIFSAYCMLCTQQTYQHDPQSLENNTSIIVIIYHLTVMWRKWRKQWPNFWNWLGTEFPQYWELRFETLVAVTCLIGLCLGPIKVSRALAVSAVMSKMGVFEVPWV